MSTRQVSAVPISASKINRPVAEFPSTILGTTFLNRVTEFQTIDCKTQKQHQELKEEVRRMIKDTTYTTCQKLELINDVQILGVGYIYEQEIKDELNKIHNASTNIDDGLITDLYTISLRFRLIRQQGIRSPSDVFQKFKDGEGKFMTSFTDDVRGMLSLYDAAHLRTHRDPILDEALAFTKTHLKAMIPRVSTDLGEEITNALNHPLYTVIPRLVAAHFLRLYQKRDSHNKTLVKLSKLDYNIVQGMHQKELSSVLRWMVDLEFPAKLPYTRDRMVECYFWITAAYSEPQYAFARRIGTQAIYMISMIDDTFDAYGTIGELTLFNNAVQRWDRDRTVMDTLPEYMKVIYKALLDTYDEIGQELTMQGRAYCLNYAIDAMKKQVDAYYTEAVWYNERYVPTYEEYMDTAIVSSGYLTLETTTVAGMGDLATKEAMEWISKRPNMARASAIMARLMDDKMSHQFEQERGHVVSAVECYMKQFGVSREAVLKMCDRDIDIGWKDLNEGILDLNARIPMPLLQRILNFTRVLDVAYVYGGDAYTDSHLLKNHIITFFRDSIPL